MKYQTGLKNDNLETIFHDNNSLLLSKLIKAIIINKQEQIYFYYALVASGLMFRFYCIDLYNTIFIRNAKEQR